MVNLDHIKEMNNRGWTVTFPAQKDQRAFVIVASKPHPTHEIRISEAWANGADLTLAIINLSEKTCDSDDQFAKDAKLCS